MSGPGPHRQREARPAKTGISRQSRQLSLPWTFHRPPRRSVRPLSHRAGRGQACDQGDDVLSSTLRARPSALAALGLTIAATAMSTADPPTAAAATPRTAAGVLAGM